MLKLLLEPTEKKTLRVILYAEPEVDDPATSCPKSVPDFHSIGAIWVDPLDLDAVHHKSARSVTSWILSMITRDV